MGKSFKKTPIFGNEAESDKPAKAQANKALRRAVRVRLHTLPIEEDPEVILPLIRELSNTAAFPKEGKAYQGTLVKQQMTK